MQLTCFGFRLPQCVSWREMLKTRSTSRCKAHPRRPGIIPRGRGMIPRGAHTPRCSCRRERAQRVAVRHCDRLGSSNSDMAHDETSSICGADLCRPGPPGLSAGCQGFRRHDRNREHELRSLAVDARASTRGNHLDLRFLDWTPITLLRQLTKHRRKSTTRRW